MAVDRRGDVRSGSIVFDDSEQPISGANIKVVGVGGGGGNAINRMIEAGIQGVQFLVANTDLQSLKASQASVKLQIGEKLTRGLGVGGDPERGRQSALEDTEKIIEALEGSDMVFITAGLGGGTGTGAAPIIASLATELGALTVAVVTKPFRFEGRRRQRQAEQGLNELRECVDTVITIPNERLLNAVPKGTRFHESFRLVDDVLLQAVQGISDIITVPGLINVDFADVKAIMEGMGMALMGTGSAAGENRALEATQRAISSPLLEEASIEGAKGLLVNVSGGADLTLFEVNEAMSIIHDAADPDANIIFGAVLDERLTNEMKITVIATGFDKASAAAEPNRPYAAPDPAAAGARVTTGPLGGQNPGTPEPMRREDINVPAFMRKKAD
ncbi:MAG TPA: cell division protein FtsZ [Blastocatellia bacterium]|nr:cell division protein FtsZ [Blastocatellia bacterium]